MTDITEGRKLMSRVTLVTGGMGGLGEAICMLLRCESKQRIEKYY
jgi:NAD(P)-dependent dehydrogenase (short-subunit alcohol dehydrogenase family)